MLLKVFCIALLTSSVTGFNLKDIGDDLDDGASHGGRQTYSRGSAVKYPSSSRFSHSAGILGTGYDILEGNPHAIALGARPTTGALSDPGLTKLQILKLTWSNKTDHEGYHLPDAVKRGQVRGKKCRRVLDRELIPGVLYYNKLLLANTIDEYPRNNSKDCKSTYFGEDYRGTRNTTAHQRTCDKWADEDHNYCRYKEGFLTPGCQVSNDVEACKVPMCSPQLKHDMQKVAFLGPYRRQPSTTDKHIYFETKNLCNDGQLDWDFESPDSGVQVSEDFKREVCRLPDDFNAETKPAFMNFIDIFGTNIIVGATVGRMFLWRTEVSSKLLFTDHILNTEDSLRIRIVNRPAVDRSKPIDQYLTFSLGSTTRKWRKSIEAKFDNRYRNFHYLLGDHKIARPLKLQLVSLDEALKMSYWRKECGQKNTVYGKCCQRIDKMQANMNSALVSYPTYKGIWEYRKSISPNNPDNLFPAGVIAVKSQWPAGFYSLPAAGPNCPPDWVKGSISHSVHGKSVFSKKMYAASPYTNKAGYHFVQLKFCTKSEHESRGPKWPKGSYCIHRVQKCPEGFQVGQILWGDVHNSMNSYEGFVPDGSVGAGTNLELIYCCRKDRSPQVPMVLPTTQPFVLMMIADKCQEVKGMKVYVAFVHWDSYDLCAISCPRRWQQHGLHPKNDYSWENNKLYYCYYVPE